MTTTPEPSFPALQNGVGRGPFTTLKKVGSNATAAKMLPGIAVVKDTYQTNVKSFTSGFNVVGVLGWESTPPKYRSANVDTAYAVGDWVAVESGPGKRRMRLTTSQTIVVGDPLKLTTDGYLTKATLNGAGTVNEAGSATDNVGNDDVYAYAAEDKTTTSSAAVIWVVTTR